MTLSLDRPQAILFDWDNTLVNTWPTIHEALNHCMEQMGRPLWSLEEVKGYVKKSMREAFPELFGDQWEDAAHIYQSYYREIHLRNLNALPGAELVLQSLKDSPIYVGVCSNKRGPNLRKECEHLGWNHYFSAVVGADDTPADKPDPSMAKLALEQASLSSDAPIWFIGDTVVDLECAANLGATPILYGDVTPESEQQYQGHFFAAHLRDHAELLSLIAG